MRQIVLDTETTGLEPTEGHRIIEIGCVEIVNRRPTQQHFQRYLNPEREIDEGALQVHGITQERLASKPRFAEVAEDLLEFIRGAELIIHNAPFDLAFLNTEFERLDRGWGRVEDYCSVLDTLELARQLHPGQRNSLDALCKRYNVDNSQRTQHGALLDAQILVDVYLGMTGGQTALFADNAPSLSASAAAARSARADRPPIKVIKPSAEELAAHARRLEQIDRASDGKCLWKGLSEPG
jgi:DNA polymerase-3 subunit epsilon